MNSSKNEHQSEFNDGIGVAICYMHTLPRTSAMMCWKIYKMHKELIHIE